MAHFYQHIGAVWARQGVASSTRVTMAAKEEFNILPTLRVLRDEAVTYGETL
jgi:hypothetical protein